LAQRLQDSSHIQAKIDVHSLFAHDTRRVDYGPPDQPAHWATLSRQIVGLRGCVLRIEEKIGTLTPVRAITCLEFSGVSGLIT
jgi:hypothetical protein